MVLFSVQILGKEKKSTFYNASDTVNIIQMLEDLGIEEDHSHLTVSGGSSMAGCDKTIISDLTTHLTPLQDMFGIKYIYVDINTPILEQPEPQSDRGKNALDILMGLSKKYDYLPEKKNPRDQKVRMQNDVIEYMEKKGYKFLRNDQNTAGTIVNTLKNTLWYLDSKRDKFVDRSIHLPLQQFVGYYDWKAQKKPKPVVKAEELEGYVNNLSDCLLLPWWSAKHVITFRSTVMQMLDGMKKYHDYLTKKCKSMLEHHAKDTVMALKDNWTIKNVKLDSVLNETYKVLRDNLSAAECYEVLNVSDFLDARDKYEKYKLVEEISFPFPAKLFTYSQGNVCLHFVFRYIAGEKDECQRTVDAVACIKQTLPVYMTRKMRQDFFGYFARSGEKPAMLRAMYKFLTGDASGPSNQNEARVDERTLNFLLSNDDADLAYDLRSKNGKVAEPKYDPFWEKLGEILENVATVNERRHNDIMYMPIAASVRSLIEEVKDQLPVGTPVPSLSTVKRSFYPCNPYTHAAIAYTGRFKVKMAVQQRLLHSQHDDAHFAYVQYNLLKTMATQYRDYASMISIDDKAVVPVGEPGTPLSSGRSHNKSLVPIGVRLVAADHDFHIAGVVPSVLFKIQIPENPSDSFHKGQIHVTVKEKVFQPSSPMRHAVENVNILRATESADGVNLSKEMLFIFSDGGPDHRVIFSTVQLADVVMFIALDLDILVHIRCAPGQSYANPAERCMSGLNLALQNVALMRDQGDPAFEMKMKRLTSMTKLRNAAERDAGVKEQFLATMEPVLALLKKRFAKIDWQDEKIKVHDASENLTGLDDILKVLDPSVPGGAAKSISRYPGLKEFFEHHTRSRNYSFQVKKCRREECGYCNLNPPRLPEDVFNTLDFLPDPVPNGDGGYKSFQDVYRTDTKDDSRPALKQKPQATTTDKANRDILVAGKVRGFLQCGECGKKRVVYGRTALGNSQKQHLLRIKEELIYVCGTALSDLPLGEGLVMKEGLNCVSSIETTYYSNITDPFEEICFHCGVSEVWTGDEISQRKKEYSVVRPICYTCFTNGKPIVTRNAIKVGGKKQKC